MSTKAERRARQRERNRQHNQQSGAADASPTPPPVALQPPTPDRDEPNKESEPVPDKIDQDENKTLRWVVFADLAFTAVVAIAAVAQAWITSNQFEAMSKQLSLMQADQRPWLGLDSVPTMAEFREAADVAISVGIRNSGRSPGQVIGFGHDINVLPVITASSFSESRHTVTKDMPFSFADTLSELKANQVKKVERLVVAGELAPFNIDTEWVMTGDLLRPIEAGVMQPILVIYLKYAVLGSSDQHETWTCFLYNRDTGKWDRDPQYDHMD